MISVWSDAKPISMFCHFFDAFLVFIIGPGDNSEKIEVGAYFAPFLMLNSNM